jgi:hypothetical protein
MSLSDVFGSWLFTRYHLNFMNLVWLNAGTTALALLAIPLLPAAIVGRREEDPPPGANAAPAAGPQGWSGEPGELPDGVQ